MKFLFVVAFVLSCALFGFAQSEPSGVQIFVAKDDGAGLPGDPVEGFNTSDVPIHCVVKLDSSPAATVKMQFVAVDVKGVKPETRVITVSYKTDGVEDQVFFTGKPKSGPWVAGIYRVDIFVNGKLVGSKAFPITGSTITPATKTGFVAPKAKPKPRKPRKP